MVLCWLWACAKSDSVAQAPEAIEHVAQVEVARSERPAREAPVASTPEAESGETNGPITIAVPREGTAVTRSLLSARGTATAFEGRINVRVRQGDTVLVSTTVAASAGAPEQGAWTVQLQLPEGASGAAVLEAYTTSAKDGSEQDVVGVNVTLGA